jgi:hypothetical protein
MRVARRRRRGLITLVACMIAACGGANDAIEVPLATLAAEPRHFDGRTVATIGIVRGIAEPRHYWIEDADFNRVQLVPDDVAAPYLDRTVRVAGRFELGERGLRRLHVRDIAPADRAATGARLSRAGDDRVSTGAGAGVVSPATVDPGLLRCPRSATVGRTGQGAGSAVAS